MREIRIKMKDCKEFQGNLKRRTALQKTMLKNSIDKWGYKIPVFLYEKEGEYYLLDGHGRKGAIDEDAEIPAIVLDIHSDREAAEILIEINKDYGTIANQLAFAEREGIKISKDILSYDKEHRTYSRYFDSRAEAEEWAERNADLIEKHGGEPVWT